MEYIEIEKQIKQLRKQMDAIAAKKQVTEEDIRLRNVLSIKLKNCRERLNPPRSRSNTYAISYSYSAANYQDTNLDY
jgi:regulator of replication initiation timing